MDYFAAPLSSVWAEQISKFKQIARRLSRGPFRGPGSRLARARAPIRAISGKLRQLRFLNLHSSRSLNSKAPKSNGKDYSRRQIEL